MPYYAVRVGKKPGIYTTWTECKAQIHGFSGAVYKKFEKRSEAEAFCGLEGADTSVDALKAEEKPADDVLFDPASIASDAAVAYVDGSFNKKTKVFGYGVVYFTEEGKETWCGHGEGEDSRHRNVAGEVLGAMQAMEKSRATGKKSLTLYYDYAGIRHWALGEWKANLPLTKRYRAFAADIRQSLALHFVKVAAHTGDRYNEEADRLAKKGAGV